MASARYRVALFAAALGLLVACTLEQLPGHATDVDVLLYSAAAARANAEGALPYVAAWIEKGPLAMALFQGLFALFGAYDMAAVVAMWFVLAAAGMALAWFLSVEMGAAEGAPWAAVLYVVAVGPLAGTLNTELPASVAVAAAVVVWCRGAAASRPRALAGMAAGALTGAALLCRQNAGILWPVLVGGELLLVWTGRRSAHEAWRGALAVTAGFLAVTGGTIALYAAAGRLEPFMFCFYGYNREIYIAATRVGWQRLLDSPLTAARNFLLPAPTTGLLGLVGVPLALAPARRGPGADPRLAARVVVATSAMALTASLFVGLRFFSHYFGLVLPLWAALGGLALHRLSSRWGRRGAVVVAAIGVLALGGELRGRDWLANARQVRNWIGTRGLSGLSDTLTWPGHDALAGRVALYVRHHSTPANRIFVWGMRPHVYAYAGRIPSTRFVTCTFLTGLVPWERSAPEEDTSAWIVPGAWDLLMKDLLDEPPRFIVDASHDHLFGGGAYAPSHYPPLATFMETRYRKVYETGEGDRMIVWQRVTP